MVETEYIHRRDLDALVHLVYDGDEDLLREYHVKPNMVLGEAVQSTLSMIDDTSRTLDFDYLKVTLDGEPIGYFCVFPKCLYSFGIAKKYRTKEILTEFWEKIRKELPDDMVCILYKNNTRAINWLLKCGCTAQENDFGDNSITLII